MATQTVAFRDGHQGVGDLDVVRQRFNTHDSSGGLPRGSKLRTNNSPSVSMFEEIVGTSPALQATLSLVTKVATADSTVLLTGETGTGKELVARATHRRSNRSTRAFVSVNCAAIPRGLIASELFGHEKGAFTGATQQRMGKFELANGGTLFLDEVGELPAETQIALLRVLQEHEFERVGGTRPIRADVRVIAATNRDLQAAISDGSFRSDLFYRLHVFPIKIPSLRERKEDIPLLVEYFIDRYARKAGKKITTVEKKTLELLRSYPWPGNIRELQNVIERSVILCETEIFSLDETWSPLQLFLTGPKNQTDVSRSLLTQEKNMIEVALKESRGRVFGPSGAAVMLGVPSSSLLTNVTRLVMLTILCTLFVISGTKSGMAQTQELAANEQAGDQDHSAAELAKQATNPLSSSWLMQTQQNNNWVGMPLHLGDRVQSNLLFQPLMNVKLTDKWTLFTRPIFTLFNSTPYVDQTGKNQRTTAFGDTVLAFNLSPRPLLGGHLMFGAGPTFIFPSATDHRLGQHTWQGGPNVGVVWLGKNFIAYAFPQQWFKIGGSGPKTNQLSLLWDFTYFLKKGWSIGTNSNVLVNWQAPSGQQVTLPIGPQVGKLVKFGHTPTLIKLQLQYYPVHPSVYGPKWNVQLEITPTIPSLIKGKIF